jgi:hypothetical protein
MRFVSLRAALCAMVMAVAASGCAAIWGFQDPTDLRDASTDDAALDGTLPSEADHGDASAGEAASEDAPGEAGASLDSADEPPPCTGACVTAPEPGWEGPFAPIEVTDGGVLDPCAAPWTESLHLGSAPSAPSASCTCHCGTPGNVTCSPPTATFWKNAFCNLACTGPGAQAPIGACTSLTSIEFSCGPTTHFSLGGSMPEGGSCVSTYTIDAGPVTFAAEMRLCAQSAPNGCASGACVASSHDSDGGDMPTLCVARAGTWPCPAGFDVPHAAGDASAPYGRDVVDNRTCTCSCGAPTGVVCSAGAKLYGAASCGGTAQGEVEAGVASCAATTGMAAASSTWDRRRRFVHGVRRSHRRGRTR